MSARWHDWIVHSGDNRVGDKLAGDDDKLPFVILVATATTLDNRISFGCINIPVKFYEEIVQPSFVGTKGIVYVLPETKPLRAVFASYGAHEADRKSIPRAAHRTAGGISR